MVKIMYVMKVIPAWSTGLASSIIYKGGSDGGASGAWVPPLFEALFKNSKLLENNGACGFQLSTKAHTMAYKL